jgi:hypothetical protein
MHRRLPGSLRLDGAQHGAAGREDYVERWLQPTLAQSMAGLAALPVSGTAAETRRAARTPRQRVGRSRRPSCSAE